MSMKTAMIAILFVLGFAGPGSAQNALPKPPPPRASDFSASPLRADEKKMEELNKHVPPVRSRAAMVGPK
jgi:hypothetical protein